MNFRPAIMNPASLGAWRRMVMPFALLCTALLALCIGASRVFAQMNTGTILGTVVDASGGAVPGAKITITNTGTQISQTLVTDTSGNYSVPTLIPGNYDVAAEKEGFQKSIRSGITLQIDQKARVDLTLQVGAVTQTVEVSGQAPLVQTSSSEHSEVITSDQITSLPMNDRNFSQLVALNTGAVPDPGDSVGPDNPQGMSYMHVNGTDSGANNWIIDGISDNESFFSIITVNPSLDAIQEFKVSTSDYAAEFGRAGGANVQISIKSGTNAYHGDAFEFVRNSDLDASDFFTNEAHGKIPPFKQNQFGANLGGPLKKDRTFFFVDYEGYRSREGQSELEVLPSLLQRQGIFTEPGNPTLYNPNDVVNGVPQPFANNTIPLSMQDPAAKNIVPLIPKPNVVAPIGSPNFSSTIAVAHTTDGGDARIDHRLSEKDQMFVRYSMLNTILDTPNFMGPVIGGDPFLASLATTRDQNVAISEIHTFSPQTINEFRFGINRVRTDWTGPDVNLKTSDQVGIPGINDFCGTCGGLVRIGIAGFNTYGHTPYAPTYRHDTIFQYVDNVTFIRGKHTFKVGADIRRQQADLYQTENPIGEFDFDQRITSDLGATGTGSGFASFLLGNTTTAGRAALTDYPSNRGFQTYFFGQDDWKVNQKLTLNIGARWEYYSPETDAHKNIANFDLTSGDILLGCIATSCSGGVKPQWTIIEPRVGLAYSPDHGKTAIRAGFGESAYSPGWGGQIGTLNDNYPFVTGQALTPANYLTYTSGDPLLSEGLPALPPVATRPSAPAGHIIPNGGGAGGANSSIFWQDPHLKMTQVWQWSFDIQRSITPNLLLDAAYVGNSVEHIFVTLPGNYPEPGVVTATGETITEARPYYNVDPLMAGFSRRQNSGHSMYHSLQLKLEKRTSYGLSYLIGYTASKNIEDGVDYVDPDHYMNKDIVGYDTPQRLVASYKYELPFGQKRHFGNHWNRAEDAVLGGWYATGITTYNGGFPFAPSITSTLDNGNGNAPNRVCSGRLSHRTIQEWYDWQCFVAPPTNVFGNMGYNILRGPGYRDWDLGLLKNFVFTETKYLQFRGEFFNLPNNVNFGTPNSYQCGGGCGEGAITSIQSRSIPRQIQFAFKLFF